MFYKCPVFCFFFLSLLWNSARTQPPTQCRTDSPSHPTAPPSSSPTPINIACHRLLFASWVSLPTAPHNQTERFYFLENWFYLLILLQPSIFFLKQLPAFGTGFNRVVCLNSPVYISAHRKMCVSEEKHVHVADFTKPKQ